MNLTTIQMDRHTARRCYLEYQRAVKVRHDEEMDQIRKSYLALSLGQSLLDLNQAILGAGVFSDSGLPRMAVADAAAKWCHLFGEGQGRIAFASDRDTIKPSFRRGIYRLTMPEVNNRIIGGWHTSIRAMVPIVPPSLRPSRGLEGYTILWEAEWKKVAPKDPLLLKKVTNQLYAIVAQWDLTEVERSVLSQRFFLER